MTDATDKLSDLAQAIHLVVVDTREANGDPYQPVRECVTQVREEVSRADARHADNPIVVSAYYKLLDASDSEVETALTEYEAHLAETPA